MFLILITYNLIWSLSVFGNWEKPANSFDCTHRYLCTPISNLTWVNNHSFISGAHACNAFKRHNVGNIYSYGDSYLRQIHAALIITLSGNYKSGAQISTSEVFANCTYQQQFIEIKPCHGSRNTHMTKTECNNEVHLYLDQPDENAYIYNETSSLMKLMRSPERQSSIILLSFGNHKVRRFYGREGTYLFCYMYIVE